MRVVSRVLAVLAGAAMLAGVLVGTISPTPAAAAGGEVWTPRSAAEANKWKSVTYGNGTFVAVAYDGTNRVMTSPDGTTWTARTAPEANPWYSVTYGNGMFVAVAYGGTNQVMTSPDGITWTARSAAEASGWISVTYGNGMFVAVAYYGTNRVMTSPDGITWTARSGGEADPWYWVTYGNGLFVAMSLGGTNRVMTSPDGITWTARSAAEAKDWRSVTYGNGLFVAVSNYGTNQVMTSPDGITWTARSAGESNSWFRLTYGNGLFVAVSTYGTNQVMTSPDGITWTARSAGESNSWQSVTYGNGLFVAVAENGVNRVMTSPGGAATVLGAPTLVAAKAGVGEATVAWTAPELDGGKAITGYVVTPYIGGVAQTSVESATDRTSKVVTGLTNGTTYTFKVAAVNAMGTGPQSAASNTVTPNPATTPDPPTGVTAKPGRGQATVTWTTPASDGRSAITGYVVTPYKGGVAQPPVGLTGTGNSKVVTSLTNGTTYTFKVATVNGVGTGTQSAASNAVTPALPPGAPTIGTATAGNAEATLTWGAPASNGGSPITGYQVVPYIGVNSQPAVTFDSTATTQTITGLTSGTTYTFKVAAINAMGTGPQSAASNAVTTERVPGEPTIDSVTAGIAQATLTWTAPSSNGGSPVTGYIVTPYISGTAQTPRTFEDTATSQTITGLTRGTTYTFKVAAINALGTGPQSTGSNAVTLPDLPGAPIIGAVKSGDGFAILSWTSPSSSGGLPITGYIVTPYLGSTAQTPKTLNSTATTQTITGLSVGKAYSFRVAAKNAVGTGPKSTASGAVTPTASISAAASPTRTVVGSTVTISGTVKPGYATSSVKIERKVNGVWEYRATANVDRATGNFRLTVKPSQKGTYAMRVRSAGGSVISKTIYFEVYAGMGTVSGSGEGNSKPIYFSGGSYYVIGSYSDSGYCDWNPFLEGITDKSAYFNLPYSSGSSTKTNLYNVERGYYYVDMYSLGDGPCNWSMTFYRR